LVGRMASMFQSDSDSFDSGVLRQMPSDLT
jgi:hypothetical protein